MKNKNHILPEPYETKVRTMIQDALKYRAWYDLNSFKYQSKGFIIIGILAESSFVLELLLQKGDIIKAEIRHRRLLNLVKTLKIC